jgi:hypothetical protein
LLDATGATALMLMVTSPDGFSFSLVSSVVSYHCLFKSYCGR